MPKTSKRIIYFMFIILFTICIAGCEKTNGAQVNATPDVAATPSPTASQTSVPETSTQSTNSTVATTMSHENAVFIPQPQEETTLEETPTEEVYLEETPTEEVYLEETTMEETTTEEDIIEETDNPDEDVSSNCWGIISTSTEVETSTGLYPVERGVYILIYSECDSSYTISWYSGTATIPCDCVQVLENITPEQEQKILQSRTVGVIEP